MRLRSKAIALILSATAFLAAMSTAFAQQKDSVKFSINEGKALVDAWLSLPGFVEINDSLKSANKIIDNRLKDCEDLNEMYREQNKNYHFYAETMSKEIDKQDEKIKKLDFWRKFWKNMTGAVGLTGAGLIIVNEIKD